MSIPNDIAVMAGDHARRLRVDHGIVSAALVGAWDAGVTEFEIVRACDQAPSLDALRWRLRAAMDPLANEIARKQARAAA